MRNKKKTNVFTEARLLAGAHRVVAALADDYSAGKGLVVDLDLKCPVSAV